MAPDHPRTTPTIENAIHNPNSGMSIHRAWLTLVSLGALIVMVSELKNRRSFMAHLLCRIR